MNLSLQGVTKVYATSVAMEDVSLQTEDSLRTLVLIGPSGGGKSTFLRVVAGLTNPDAGEVTVEGERVRFGDRTSLLEHRRKNGFVFQSWNLFPHLSALQNVSLPLEKVHGMEPEQAAAVAEAQLRQFRLGDHLLKRPSQMSGGQQQRVALARAIAPKPRLLLLDEPTSALDPEMTAEVLELIENLCKEGQNILLSTHEMGFAKAVADKIVFLSEGKIRAFDEPDAIFGDGAVEEVSRFLRKVMRY